MSEEQKNNIKVIAGHNASILQQLNGLLTFVNEVGAIGEYEKRGFTHINVGLVLNEIKNGIESISQSVKIIEQMTQELQSEEEKKE